MRHLGTLLLVFLLVGACTTPPSMVTPAPTLIASPLTPTAVAQTAVQLLAMRGFTVMIGDATGGTVVATHAIQAGDADRAKELLACQWGDDAVGWKWVGGTVTMTVTARATTTGSAVTIAGTTQTSARMGLGADPSGTDRYCVSNGKAEAALAAAVVAQ